MEITGAFLLLLSFGNPEKANFSKAAEQIPRAVSHLATQFSCSPPRPLCTPEHGKLAPFLYDSGSLNVSTLPLQLNFAGSKSKKKKRKKAAAASQGGGFVPWKSGVCKGVPCPPLPPPPNHCKAATASHAEGTLAAGFSRCLPHSSSTASFDLLFPRFIILFAISASFHHLHPSQPYSQLRLCLPVKEMPS